MKIHEFQARQLLAQAGVAVPAFAVAEDVATAVAEAKKLFDSGIKEIVIKAQVHAGGRGKAGFVKLVSNLKDAEAAATFMLTNKMVSYQTGPEGLVVRKLLIAAAEAIAKEYYLAITIDRARRTATLIASAEGGVEIEVVAEKNPAAIIKVPLHPLLGLQAFQARELAFRLGFKGKQVGQAADIMMKVGKVFRETDASLVEINPLVVTPPDEKNPDGRVLALDAKFQFDDNALFRHPDLAKMFDPTEENPAEIRAHEFGLSYVALDGNIGCLVNGAGLAMATMDIVKLHGGEPANFLDVGGSASEEAVTEAFRIILSDPNVKGILVNIFGGIMKCDIIAEGVIAAVKDVGLKVPLVVRLEGTNVELGKKIIRESGLNVIPADDLDDAAQKIVKAVKEAR
jgi:succinyl-CoA synthetase beta subunit